MEESGRSKSADVGEQSKRTRRLTFAPRLGRSELALPREYLRPFAARLRSGTRTRMFSSAPLRLRISYDEIECEPDVTKSFCTPSFASMTSKGVTLTLKGSALTTISVCLAAAGDCDARCACRAAGRPSIISYVALRGAQPAHKALRSMAPRSCVEHHLE